MSITSGNRASHFFLPEEKTGYALDHDYSWWAVIVPEGTENLIKNPSFEINLQPMMFSTGNGNIVYVRESASAVGAVAGLYSLKLTHTGPSTEIFAYLDDISVTSGAYTWSAYVYITKPPVTVIMQVLNAAGLAPLSQRQYIIERTGWQRIQVTHIASGSGQVNPAIKFIKNSASAIYYLDALQFERKPYATTYCDGDMLGWFDTNINQSYYWRGVAHGSVSVRRDTTGSGGRIVGLSDTYKFYTTGIIGLGMSPVSIQTLQLSDGTELTLGSRDIARDFTITGKIYASNYKQLTKIRQELIDLLRPNKTPGREPFILRYHPIDSNGQPYGIPLDIVCTYGEGLQGNINNFYQENIGLQFRASDPTLYEGIDNAKSLNLYENIAYKHVLYRDNTGKWFALGPNFSTINKIAGIGWDKNGDVIIAGNFSSGGDFPIVNVARYREGVWESINDSSLAGFNNEILCLETSRNISDGYMMVGGNFTYLDNEPCGYVAVYNPYINMFSEIEVGGASGLNGRVYDIKRGADGHFYLCGEFTGRYGTTPNNNFHNDFLGSVCRYDPVNDTIKKMGNGYGGVKGGFIYSVLPGNDGYVYAAGNFTNIYDNTGASLSTNFGVARWNSITDEWELMGDGIDETFGIVYKLLYGVDGAIYAVGDFTKSAGTTPYDLRGFARWNGSGWEEVFDLNSLHIDNPPASTHFLTAELDSQGIFWFWGNVGVQFDVPGFGKQYMFGWRNGIFYPQPFWVNSGSATSVARIGSAAFGYGGEMLIGINAKNTGSNPYIHVPAHHKVNYVGNADGKPEFHFQNKMQLVSIQNFTINQGIYFREDGALGNGETVHIRTGSLPQVISNARVNAKRIINVGPSSMSKFHLAPGTNYISVFARNTGTAGTNYVKWRNRFYSIDSAS